MAPCTLEPCSISDERVACPSRNSMSLDVRVAFGTFVVGNLSYNYFNYMTFGSDGFVGDWLSEPNILCPWAQNVSLCWLSLGSSNTHRMFDLRRAMHVLEVIIHECLSGHFGTIMSWDMEFCFPMLIRDFRILFVWLIKACKLFGTMLSYTGLPFYVLV